MNIIERLGLPGVFKPTKSRAITGNPNSGDKRDNRHMTEKVVKPGLHPQSTELNIEANRLRTFDGWTVSFINKHQLAMLGFYYYGPRDFVKCYFCGVEVGMWEEGDDVLTDHKKWSPSCKFIRRHHTNNVPINKALFNQILPRLTPTDIFGPGRHSSTVSEDSSESSSEDDVHIQHQRLYDRVEYKLLPSSKPTISRPAYPEFAVEAKRLESYDDGWSKTINQCPHQLSDAGFFYTGKRDRVCCFSCGGGLKDWEKNDEPWEQHAMWYGKCEYLKLIKGPVFIEKMTKKRDEMSNKSGNENVGSCSNSRSLVSSLAESCLSAKLEDPVEKVDEEEKESELCKICYSNDYNTIFLPCGHVIACAKCASSVTKCPACRQPFENVNRIFFL